MTRNRLIALAALAGAVAGAANAGVMGFAVVDQLGGEARMDSGFIPGVFDSSPTSFTDAALQLIHADIAADVETSDRISFALLETDAGLAFTTLVDQQPNLPRDGRGVQDNRLLMVTTAAIGRSAFINDDGSDLGAPFVLGGREVVGGAFGWNESTDPGDGFAWGGLQFGDFVDASFTEGVDQFVDADVFQFLTFNAIAQQWEIAATGDFTSAGQFSYSAQIIPAPAGVVALSAFCLAGLERRRR